MSSTTIFFDLETIPDISFIKTIFKKEKEQHEQLTDIQIDSSTDEKIYELASEILTHNRSKFLPPIFHQIVGWVILCTDRKGIPFKKTDAKHIWSDDNEKEGLKKFIDTINQLQVKKVVHFNGRGFDIPLLRYRAIKHRLQLPKLFSEREFNYRYGSDNIDLMDQFSSFGASSFSKLERIATLIGIDLKKAGSGMHVWDYFKKKDYKKIANYCLEDVIGTYLVWLAWTYTMNMGLSEKEYHSLYNRTQKRLYEIQQEYS